MSLLIEACAGPAPADLFAHFHSRPGSFFLDSGMAAEGLGAYSFIGFDPFLTFAAWDKVVVIDEGGRTERRTGEPLAELRTLLKRFRSPPHPELPFTGGAVGYLSYNYGASWEIRSKHPSSREEAPDIEWRFYDGILAYQHAAQRWWLVANPVHQRTGPAILEGLRRVMAEARGAPGPSPEQIQLSEPRACSSPEWYLSAVERIREYIRAGDVYQVNLAQRFEASWSGNPYALYQKLRARSPAPFASFLSTGTGHILSCSPERFLRLRGGKVETRPIKGTRPRGRDADEDRRLARELVHSVKERAELLMIVDLERNDLGRVCKPGTIQVQDLYRLETHPTVFHLVATVSGELRPECDALDLLRAAFPGGSITGAPKIRAMQIIDELEIAPRHVYTGSLGYLGFDGGCDLNIAIRTVVTNGRQASYHVGAGIVWDSDPRSEYEETLAKGRALREALSQPSTQL